MPISCSARFIMLMVVCLLAPPPASDAAADANLDREKQEEFLLNAKVIRERRTAKGITNPYRLTLEREGIIHDASFQPVFERKNYQTFDNGRSEINYVDSYLYNIAAYRLATMLGLEQMMPVTVERTWNGKKGSLSWWLPVQMDEGERLKKKIHPPDIEAFNRQMYKIRVFTELVYDTDRNIGNVLIGKNWELYMIDFSRAFRLYNDLKNAGNLERCSQELLAKLQQLSPEAIAEKTGELLTDSEIKAVIARRDRIVEHFRKLIAEKGEKVILY
jgi:hypothetical protein